MSLPTQATSEHFGPQGLIVSYSLNIQTPSYVAFTDVKSITPPPTEWDESDDTQLASTGQMGESSPGWGKPGEIELDLFIVQAQDLVLATLANNRAKALIKIQYPPLSTQTTGLIIVVTVWTKSHKHSQASTTSSDKQHSTTTFKVTGVQTLTQGA